MQCYYLHKPGMAGLDSFNKYLFIDSFMAGSIFEEKNQFLNLDHNSIVLMTLFGLLAVLVILACFLRKKYKEVKEKNLLIDEQIASTLQAIEILQSENANLQKTENQLKEINITKDKFFSIISHDLRGPLNSITGLLQILIAYTDSFSKEELQDFARNMDKSVKNLLDLLTNLLRWSQTQSGQIEYRPQSVDLQMVVNNTVNLLEVAASNKNLQVSVNIAKAIKVYADLDMLSFILRNLIHNAIKFTYTGGQIHIYSTLKDKEVEISVTDNGKGISKHDIDKLFKIDSCYTTAGTAKEIGTGLGLILCSEFIEKNGGSIFVESELKKGTSFRFTLPHVTISQSELIAISDH